MASVRSQLYCAPLSSRELVPTDANVFSLPTSAVLRLVLVSRDCFGSRLSAMASRHRLVPRGRLEWPLFCP